MTAVPAILINAYITSLSLSDLLFTRKFFGSRICQFRLFQIVIHSNETKQNLSNMYTLKIMTRSKAF